MDKINVDANVVQGKADKVSTGASLFQMDALPSTDNESTITANETAKQSYKECQNISMQLEKALDQEAKNIQSLGVRFKEFDKLAADSFKSIS